MNGLSEITLRPLENFLLTGAWFVSEPPELPSCDEVETEESSLFRSTPFLCNACGEEDCAGDCVETYLLMVRGRVEVDGPIDEMCAEHAHCYRQEVETR